MTGERIQLHSSLGRLLLLAQGYLPWVALSGCATAFVVAALRGRLGVSQLPSLLVAIPFVLFARWARRNATPVFATPEGLELSKQGRTIAWSSVAKVWQVPLGSVIPVYRVTFTDGTPPLTFYCSEDLERIVARFKAPAPATPRKAPAT